MHRDFQPLAFSVVRSGLKCNLFPLFRALGVLLRRHIMTQSSSWRHFTT